MTPVMLLIIGAKKTQCPAIMRIMKLKESLKFLIEKYNLNTMDLARRTGVGQPVIYRIISGETEDPKISTLSTLADYFHISIDQLIGNAPLDIKDNERKQLPSIPLLTWENVVYMLAANKEQLNNSPTITTTIQTNKSIYALRIKDDSMAPIFCQDTLISVDYAKKPKNFDYVIAKTKKNKEAVFRQLIIDEDLKYLRPLNPNIEKFKIQLVEDNCAFFGVLIQSRIDY